MESAITAHLQQQPAERQRLLTQLHQTILQNDPTVTATVGTMMKMEMILYNCKGMFKYGLAGGGKAHMSLHCMPIYMNEPLHAKYAALLPKAKLQKGCINFKDETEMPVAIAAQLIADSAKIDMLAVLEQYRSNKKK